MSRLWYWVISRSSYVKTLQDLNTQQGMMLQTVQRKLTDMENAIEAQLEADAKRLKAFDLKTVVDKAEATGVRMVKAEVVQGPHGSRVKILSRKRDVPYRPGFPYKPESMGEACTLWGAVLAEVGLSIESIQGLSVRVSDTEVQYLWEVTTAVIDPSQLLIGTAEPSHRAA